MADKIINTNTLSILAEFVDGDNRTINLENPNTAINLAAQVVNLDNYLQTSQVIAGDKTGANFSGFKTAKLINKQVTKFDLGQ